MSANNWTKVRRFNDEAHEFFYVQNSFVKRIRIGSESDDGWPVCVDFEETSYLYQYYATEAEAYAGMKTLIQLM